MSANLQEDPVPERGRHQNPVSRTERRFDALARVLAIRDECTAISFFNRTFYIGTNKIHETSRLGGEKHKVIESVMDYFSAVARGEQNDPIVILRKILSKERVTLLLKGRAIPEDLYNDALENFLKNEKI